MLSITEIIDLSNISSPILSELADRSNTARSRKYIANLNKCEVGFLCYDDWSEQSLGFIYEIFILPKYRAQGIGDRLMIFAEELAKNLNCTSIRLEPHAFDHSIDPRWLNLWYLKKGYFYMPGDPKIMEKQLIK